MPRNPAKLPGYSELALQRAVVRHFRELEQRVGGFTFFHVPNGGKRSKTEGMRLKAMGVLAGVHDLWFLLLDSRVVMIELKTDTGDLIASQKAFHATATKLMAWHHTVSAATPAAAVHACCDILKRYGVHA